MRVFDLFKKTEKKPIAKKTEIELGIYEFEQAKGFRGFKRVPLTHYGYQPIEESINALKIKNPKHKEDPEEPEYIFDFEGADITIKNIQFGTRKTDKCLLVFVDNWHVGTYFYDAEDDRNKAVYKAFEKGKIEKVYVKMDRELLPGKTKLGKFKVEERYVPCLLVKYADNQKVK